MWHTDVYNVYDVELWKDGELVRAIFRDHEDSSCYKLLNDLQTKQINPKKYMSCDDIEGNYEIKLKYTGVRTNTVFESRRG